MQWVIRTLNRRRSSGSNIFTISFSSSLLHSVYYLHLRFQFNRLKRKFYWIGNIISKSLSILVFLQGPSERLWELFGIIFDSKDLFRIRKLLLIISSRSLAIYDEEFCASYASCNLAILMQSKRITYFIEQHRKETHISFYWWVYISFFKKK